MAKTRPSATTSGKRQHSRKEKSPRNNDKNNNKKNEKEIHTDIPTHLSVARSYLYSQSSPEDALAYALTALKLCIEPTSTSTSKKLTLEALELTAEILIELGNIEEARSYFLQASEIDPSGSLNGVSKFLWLAQLAEGEGGDGDGDGGGGEESIRYYEIAIEKLRLHVSSDVIATAVGEEEKEQKEKNKELLVQALCGAAEIYLSDLCMHPLAETKCEGYLAEALALSPENSEAWMTLASVRVSQTRHADAVSSIRRSIHSWLPSARATIGQQSEVAVALPSYASRISAARIAVEVGELQLAVKVLEFLRDEDDQLPDLWYLAGWAWFLMGEQEGESKESNVNSISKEECWREAKAWLKQCDILFNALEWEDDGIAEHTAELLVKISELVPDSEEEEEDEDEEDDIGNDEVEWQSDDNDDDQNDQEMEDS